jgi:hypothetical protein
MFEHHSEPLLSTPQFLRRASRYALGAFLLITGSWLIGIFGYRVFEGMAWIDAILNAAMILGGMGPINPLHTVAGKLFASFYALFSGMIFLVAVAVLLAPLLHRILHKLHLDVPDEDGEA